MKSNKKLFFSTQKSHKKHSMLLVTMFICMQKRPSRKKSEQSKTAKRISLKQCTYLHFLLFSCNFRRLLFLYVAFMSTRKNKFFLVIRLLFIALLIVYAVHTRRTQRSHIYTFTFREAGQKIISSIYMSVREKCEMSLSYFLCTFLFHFICCRCLYFWTQQQSRCIHFYMNDITWHNNHTTQHIISPKKLVSN